jgi:putative oxidoreductase
MKRPLITELVSFLITLLFVYAALSKLFDFQRFKQQMSRQPFTSDNAAVLVWTLPAVELLVSCLLLFRATRYLGFISSFILMLLFTGYVGLVLLGYYQRVPCSCGGVLKAMSWEVHFYFNVFFLLLSFLGLIFSKKERRGMAKI